MAPALTAALSRPWLLSLVALTAGCHDVPAWLADGGPADPVDRGPAPRVVVGSARAFGQEGERPTFLLPRGPDHLFALTDRAIYLLDLEGRVINREPLPAGPEGLPAVVTSARADETGLGLALSWGGAPSYPAGAYLAFSDGQGALLAEQMTRLAPQGSALRGDWDGATHQLVWLEPREGGLDLRWAAVSRGGVVDRRLLAGGLDPGESSGDWLAAGVADPFYCAVGAVGEVLLRRFSPAGEAERLTLSSPQERAIGRCRLASSGRSLAATWIRRSAAGSDTGGASAVRDQGLGVISFDVPALQLVDPDGGLLGAPWRLSLVEGTVRLESLVWDGRRYLALLDAAGVRGGRLLLAAFDEAGRSLFRDLLLPLDYDPGLLEAGRLLVVESGYYLLYSTRRPWDEGICRMVRFNLKL